MAYKMKGFSGFGNSPAKHTRKDDKAHKHETKESKEGGTIDVATYEGGKQRQVPSSPAKQEGPIDEKQLKLQPSENPDTWVYEPGEKAKKDKKWVRQEKIIGLEDRIGFIDEDVNASGKPKTDQQKKDQAKLKQELAILRKSKH